MKMSFAVSTIIIITSAKQTRRKYTIANTKHADTMIPRGPHGRTTNNNNNIELNDLR